jgi:NAD(P)-dependent dehydrogenase (short-subunit alcohol dehydrogenase family)
MRLEAEQVAVVTGGGSGIGRALVDGFGARGLTVVVADVEDEALEAARHELEIAGIPVLARHTDVRDAEDVSALAAEVMARFGRVDVICNNAGVISSPAPAWEQSAQDWLWTVQVNLLGVANGVRAFVPHLVAAGRGHVVNTSSIAGLTPIPGGGNAAYSATKHAVIGFSETLRLELGLVAPEVGVTVLCPGPVPTRIHDSERNRPSDLLSPGTETAALPKPDFGLELERVAPTEVAAQVLDAIVGGRELVLPTPDLVPLATARVEHLLHTL